MSENVRVEVVSGRGVFKELCRHYEPGDSVLSHLPTSSLQEQAKEEGEE